MEFHQQMHESGFAVLRDAVPREQVASALRRLHLEVRRRGLSSGQILEWQTGTFFPHLRWEAEFMSLLPPVLPELLQMQPDDDWAEPQLLLRFPDEHVPWPRVPHVDQPPPWANGRVYHAIVGVSLTDANEGDGCLSVWPGSHRLAARTPCEVATAAGDVVVMHPELGHCGTLNLGPFVRAAVYFRLLGPPTCPETAPTASAPVSSVAPRT